jgi:hypothetical protein
LTNSASLTDGISKYRWSQIKCCLKWNVIQLEQTSKFKKNTIYPKSTQRVKSEFQRSYYRWISVITSTFFQEENEITSYHESKSVRPSVAVYSSFLLLQRYLVIMLFNKVDRK